MNLLRLVSVIGLIGSHLLLLALQIDGAEAAGIKVLIVDGQNNHDWRATTPLMRSMLEDGGFTVQVATVPAEGLERDEFTVPLDRVHVVVGNFTDIGGAPAPTRFFDELTTWVAAGGGFVAVHAATAGMEHLPDYVRMVGLGWGNAGRGDRLVVDDSGRVIRTPKGEGPNTGHGPIEPIQVTVRSDHPIVHGLPQQWQVRDELWFAARGPAEGLHVLATGYAPQTEQNEPVLWTVDFGKGRVFVQLLGHDTDTMQDVSFRTTLIRGCQWAATGRVTLPVPADFR